MKKYVILSICFLSSLYGDWNSSYDENTSNLLSQLVQVDSEEYEREYKNFMKIREKYLQDGKLAKEIAKMTSMDKEIILRPKEDGVLIKKRRNNHIYEVFAWELSALLGTSPCVVPGFPAEIGGKVIVIQKKEAFSLPERESESKRKAIIKTVSLDAYWKAHLQAYLLGMGDLVGRNLGVNKKGQMRFFDVESSFKYENQPQRWAQSFYTGFVSQSMGWSQFKKPLDAGTVASLRSYIASLDHLEENIAAYLRCRSFPLHTEGFFYRLNKIRNFPLEEGKSFEDFYCFLFPKVGLGLEELSSLLSKILKKKISKGESLMFACRKLKKMKLSSQEKEEVQKWLSTYVGP